MQNAKIEDSIKQTESMPVARRLSTPYHGLPSVVDYDPDTGFVTFGQLIEHPPPKVHPRRYVPPAMPTRDGYPGICLHDFCLSERRRLYGLTVPEHPVGMPWASGRLKHLPGHVRVPFPLRKKSKKKRKIVSEEFTKAKRVQRACAMDEMIYFYKIVLLAGSLVSEARKEKYGKEGRSLRAEGSEKGEAGEEGDSPPEEPTDKSSVEKKPEPAEETVGEALTEGGDVPEDLELDSKIESEEQESVLPQDSGEATEINLEEPQ